MQALITSQDVRHPVCHALGEVLQKHNSAQAPALVLLAEIETQLLRRGAEFVAVVLTPDPEHTVPVISRLRRLVAGSLIVVGPTADARLILQAQHAGADLYLDETDLEPGLAAFLQRQQIKQDTGTSSSGQLLAMLSASGGCGGSTLAVNLAAVLSQAVKTLLIDLKPGANDLAGLLNLKPVHTLADLCGHAERLDEAIFESSLVQHSGGARLLAAPQKFRDISAVKPPALGRVLQFARARFPYTLVDVQDAYHEEQVLVLRQATQIVLILRGDFTAVRSGRRLLQELDALDISPKQVHLVINRVGQSSELPSSQVEEALGLKVGDTIPDDPETMNSCTNIGVPVVLEAPASKVARAIVQMARRLTGASAAALKPQTGSRPGGLTARLQKLFGR